MRAAVMGGGSWGTAFAMVLADAGNEVVLWAREPQVATSVARDHENPAYHPGITLPDAIDATADPAAALAGAELVVLAVTVAGVRQPRRVVTEAAADAVLVSLLKGIELGTMSRMTQVTVEVTGIGPERVAVVSGPNLAGEIVLRQPAASTVACTDGLVAQRVADA